MSSDDSVVTDKRPSSRQCELRVKLGTTNTMIEKEMGITRLPVVIIVVNLFEKEDNLFVNDLQGLIEKQCAALGDIVIRQPAALIVHSGWADQGVKERVQDFLNHSRLA